MKPRWRSAACLALLFAAPASPEVRDAQLQALAEQAAAQLPVPARDALARIAAFDRRLLALRSYVRNGSSIEPAWSWSESQIAAFEGSLEQQALNEAIGQVRLAFEAANPGYTLHVNPEVRSLELQLQRWNGNPRVGATAQALLQSARQWPLPPRGAPGPEALEVFRAALIASRPDPPAPLAAPGLSAHGRMRAVDFQVVKGPEIVAGTETASIEQQWTMPGWTLKLAQAVASSGAPFTGPLRSPEEPWHYIYQPPAPSSSCC